MRVNNEEFQCAHTGPVITSPEPVDQDPYNSSRLAVVPCALAEDAAMSATAAASASTERGDVVLACRRVRCCCCCCCLHEGAIVYSIFPSSE
jgi:hypothetical protein